MIAFGGEKNIYRLTDEKTTWHVGIIGLSTL